MRRLALGLIALLGTAAASAAPFPWPGGAKAAVSLSYDDALPSQLDVALPALNRHGLKATFYLTLANEAAVQRLPEWRAAAAQGHELGNHTLFHACSRSAAPGRDWIAPHRDLDTTSVAQIRDEVLLANAYLHAIDGQTERSFTVPCLDTRASGQSYLPAIRSAFVAIKARPGGITADVATLDPYDVGTAGPEGLSGAALIALVEQAAASGGLASLTFHGVGGDYLSVSTPAHEALLAHLAAHPERFWVDSFVTVMRHVKARQAEMAAKAAQPNK